MSKESKKRTKFDEEIDIGQFIKTIFIVISSLILIWVSYLIVKTYNIKQKNLIKKKDIQIESKNGYLTIVAEKKVENDDEDKKKNYIRRERCYGKYERSFYLGDLESDNIEASFTDGILKIVVPKKEESENKKFIEIK